MTIKDNKKKATAKGANVKQSTEIDRSDITPHVELPTIADRIKQETAKFNFPGQKIAALKRELDKLKIDGPEDKKGYLLVDNFRKTCKSLAVACEAKRVELKAEYLEIGRGIDKAAKEIEPKLRELESEAAAKLKVIDDEKARVAREIEESKAAALKERIDSLEAAGLVFNGVAYVLGQIYISTDIIATLNLEEFAALLETTKNEKTKLDEEAETRRRQEEDERKRQEEQRVQLEQQRQDQERRENELKEKEERIANQEREALDARNKQRQSQLMHVGLIFIPSEALFKLKTVSGEVAVTLDDIIKMEPVDWDVNIEMVTDLANSINDKEKKRRADEEEFNNRVRMRAGQLSVLGFITFERGYIFKNPVTNGEYMLNNDQVSNPTPESWDGTLEAIKDFIATEQGKAQEIEEKRRQEAEIARKSILTDTEHIQEYFASFQGLKMPVLNTQEGQAILSKFQESVTAAMGVALDAIALKQ